MPDGHEKIQGAQVIYSNVTRKHSGRFLKKINEILNKIPEMYLPI